MLPVRCVSFDTVCCVPLSLVPKTAEAAVTGSRQGRDFVSGMIDDLESWAHRVSALTAALADRDAVIAVQAARIAELERRLGLDSSNSSKPPSRDGLAKPTAEALRQRQRSRRRASDRKPGGQTGHPGGTLRRSEHPDVITDHDPDVCTGCGAALDAGMSVGSAARQVHDLPEPPPLQVTAHRAHRCVCPACGVTTRAHFPDGVIAPVQSGPRLTARVVYLSVAQLIPVQRLRQTLIDLFGVQRSQGTLMNMVSRAAAGLEGLVLHVRDAVAAAPVKHMDETGIRVRGRLAWLHVACTGLLSHFRVGAGRGDVMRDATGVAVHDHWRPYFTIPGTVPALCAAHLLRELQDRVDFDDEAWAATMARRLRRAIHAVNLSEGKPLPARLADRIGRRTDSIVAAGISMHESRPPPPTKGRRGRRKRRRGHNLVRRLQDNREGVLRFTRDPTVPATNNEAERALRPLKVQQKISGSFRSTTGAQNHAVLRTVLDTARKQGWNLLETLRAPPDELIQRLEMS